MPKLFANYQNRGVQVIQLNGSSNSHISTSSFSEDIQVELQSCNRNNLFLFFHLLPSLETKHIPAVKKLPKLESFCRIDDEGESLLDTELCPQIFGGRRYISFAKINLQYVSQPV